MSNLTKIIGGFLGVFSIILIFVLIATLPVQLLWNWLMPFIFGLPKLGFWQTAGLLLLANLLLKSNTSTTGKKEK